MAAPMCKHIGVLSRLFTTLCHQRKIDSRLAAPLGPVMTQVRHRGQKQKLKSKSQKPVKGFFRKEELAEGLYVVPTFDYVDPTNIELGEEMVAKKPMEDVYMIDKYPPQLYELQDALLMCKEWADPVRMNSTKYVYADMLFCLHTSKRGKYIKEFNLGLVPPHQFPPHDEIKLAVLSGIQEQREKATALGVEVVGGMELMKLADDGAVDLSPIDYVIATSDLFKDLIKYRNILKNKFPTRQTGNVGEDVEEMIRSFRNATNVSLNSVDNGVGKSTITIGQLSMTVDELMANFKALTNPIMKMKGTLKKSQRVNGPFLYGLKVYAESSPEIFNVNSEPFDFPVKK